MGWINSTWQTFAEGTPARLTALRAFIGELQNSLATGSYSIGGDYSVQKAEIEHMLEGLLEREKFEAEQVGLATGTRLGWTSGRALL